MSFCHIRNHCIVIRLPKEVDDMQASTIRQECETMFMRYLVRDIIFDFSNTTFMDSSGIGLILGRIHQVEPVDGRVYLFGGNEMIAKMWEMSGICEYVTILHTIEEVKEVYA